MRFCLILIFFYSTLTQASVLIDSGIATSSVEERDINISTVQSSYTFDNVWGGTGFALGARSSSFEADTFLPSSPSEELEDINYRTLNAIAQIHFMVSNIIWGFNFDLFGVSYGDRARSSTTGNKFGVVPNNILITQGTYVSELFLNFFFTPNFGIRAGVQHINMAFDGAGLDEETRERSFNRLFGGFSIRI